MPAQVAMLDRVKESVGWWRLGDSRNSRASMRAIDSTVESSIASAVRRRKRFFVLTAPFGSMGDQALSRGALEAARLAGVHGTVLVPGPSDPWCELGIMPVESFDHWHEGPHGTPSEHARCVVPSSSIAVVGADCIDGRYNHLDIATRVRLLNLTAASGGLAQLVNFSISASPTRTAVKILRGLRSDVELWARDELSRARAESIFRRSVETCADVGCFMPADVSARVLEMMENPRVAGRPLVCLVPNGHVATDFGSSHSEVLAFWIRLASELISAGWFVIVMPHDVRERTDDVGLARRILESAEVRDAGATTFIPVSGAEAKGLVSQVDLCIGARMHACVGALSSGTPTIGLDYLNKFEGQFAWYQGLGTVVPDEYSLNVTAVMEPAARLVPHDASSREKRQAPAPPSIGWLGRAS